MIGHMFFQNWLLSACILIVGITENWWMSVYETANRYYAKYCVG